MRPFALMLGLILIVVGGLVVTDRLDFTEKETVLEIGGLEASVERERDVPQVVGIVLIVVGAVTAGYGLLARRRR